MVSLPYTFAYVARSGKIIRKSQILILEILTNSES